MAPGVAALALVVYHLAFEAPGLAKAVQALEVAQVEERLDNANAALCMAPGDPGVLERIRELQQRYETLVGRRYTPPACSLLLKLKG